MLSDDLQYQEILRRAAVSMEKILSGFDVKTRGKFIQAFYNELDSRCAANAFDDFHDEIKHQWYVFVDALDEAYNHLNQNNEEWFEYMEDFIADAFEKLRSFDGK